MLFMKVSTFLNTFYKNQKQRKSNLKTNRKFEFTRAPDFDRGTFVGF